MSDLAELIRLRMIVIQTFKGGPGSGNFGHSGRPGEVGGSQSYAGMSNSEMTTYANSKLDSGEWNYDQYEAAFSKWEKDNTTDTTQADTEYSNFVDSWKKSGIEPKTNTSTSLFRGDTTGKSRMIARDKYRDETNKILSTTQDALNGRIDRLEAINRIENDYNNALNALDKWEKTYRGANMDWNKKSVLSALGKNKAKAIDLVNQYGVAK